MAQTATAKRNPLMDQNPLGFRVPGPPPPIARIHRFGLGDLQRMGDRQMQFGQFPCAGRCLGDQAAEQFDSLFLAAETVVDA